MSEEKALIPLEEKTVDFYGDNISAALVKVKTREEVYVPLRPLCDYLGLDWSSQRKRLNRDQVLADFQGVVVMTTPSGKQQSICLPLKFLPGWLFGVDTNRVKPELREKIIRYRRECYDVLWQAFQDEAIALTDEDASLFDVETVPKEPNPELVRIREMGLAIARLAQQQLDLEQSVGKAHNRLDQAARVVGNLQKRVSKVEDLIQPAKYVSEQQAATISNTIKLLANQLTKQGAKGSQYQAVFSEIYRRFGVSDYKSIRRDQYQAVLDFLEEWRQSAGGQPRPQQTSMEVDQ